MGLACTNILWSIEIEHSSPIRETSTGKKYDEAIISQMIDFLIDNIHIKIGNHLFRQYIGILMGTNCAPLSANLFLYSYKGEFLRSIKKSNKKFAKASLSQITRQRMENQIVSTKIACPRFGQYKNNSPKGWVAQK